MISFDCPCGKPFRFSQKFCGRPFRCIACGRPLVVPKESQTTLTADEAPVGPGEVIAPVKPVLQIDLGSLPDSLKVKKKSVPTHLEKNRDNESYEDEIIISGNLPKAREESAFHADFDIDDPDEADSTSTVLSKAAIARQIKIKKEQEQIEAAQAAEIAPEQKPAKKAGVLSGLFKKKPKTTDATDKSTPAPKTKEKPPKASKKQPQAQPAVDSAPEKPKKAGFLSGLFKKKPKATDTTEGEVAKPLPAKKEPKAAAPKKEKVKKGGFLSGLFKKKPKATDTTEGEVAKPLPAKKEPKVAAPKKEKVKKDGFLSKLFTKKPKAPKATDATNGDM